jgi:GTP cyclohydrolase FolE2
MAPRQKIRAVADEVFREHNGLFFDFSQRGWRYYFERQGDRGVEAEGASFAAVIFRQPVERACPVSAPTIQSFAVSERINLENHRNEEAQSRRSIEQTHAQKSFFRIYTMASPINWRIIGLHQPQQVSKGQSVNHHHDRNVENFQIVRDAR